METGKVQRPQTLTNNWQSHRVKLATVAAFHLGDGALIARARKTFEKQIAANLRPDGSVLDFGMRDALHYVVYYLEPLLIAAYAAKEHGQDWYGFATLEGASLPRSVDWLAPYARDERTHAEFVHSVVPFDRQRREAGLATFQNADWQVVESAQVFALASSFDPRYGPLRDQLIARAEAHVAEPWLLLAAAAPTAGQPPAMSLVGPGLRTDDLEGAVRFYRDGLGMTLAARFSTDLMNEAVMSFGPVRTPPFIFLLRRSVLERCDSASVGTLFHPSSLAASTRPWPAMISPWSLTSTGLVNPNRSIEAAICLTCFLECVRALRA